MFELEIIGLLNELKKSEDKDEFIKIKNSIANLIEENKEAYAKFLDTQALDEETKSILSDCEDIIQHKTEQASKPVDNDFKVIKQYYESWLEEYIKNNRIPNKRCENIVNEIINFYALNRILVLEQTFKVKDSTDFEDFKNMIKNYLRKFFAIKIEEYCESDNFKQKGFFAKRSKRKEILKILEKIGKYEFNVSEIMEVISS